MAGGAGLPGQVNPNIDDSFGKINGVLGQGRLTPTSDPNIYNINFQAPARTNGYYPTVRVDANVTDKERIYASYAQTLTNDNLLNPPQFPGAIPSDQSLNYT